MGMTIDESLEWLISIKEHYEMDDNCQELAQALDMAINAMRKYQKIKQIIQEWRDSGLGRGQLYEIINGVLQDENVG